MTDPFRPFAATSAPFPRVRLERAGVPASAVDDLEAAYADQSPDERREFAQFVTSRSDAAIAERYGEGPPPAPTTREELEAETVDDLEARIRRWNEEHPAEHLSTSGRKAELIGRLLDAYEGEQGDAPSTATSPPPAPDGATGTAAPASAPTATTTPAPATTAATATVPTAPVATTPEGAPATGTQTPDAAGAGATTTTGGTP